MKSNLIWSPGISTNNLMDVFIHQTIENELHQLFPNSFFRTIPTKHRLTGIFRRHLRKSQFVFVAGTNLIASRMHFPHTKLWQARLRDAPFVKELILVGVGWRNYEGAPDIYTRLLLKSLLSKNFIHSVRDSYTESKLRSIGINNVINTGCPTMWALSPEFVSDIPSTKAQHAVLTLLKNRKIDKQIAKTIVEVVKNNYDKVFFWPQGHKDLSYLQQSIVGTDWQDRITILSPHLEAYKNLLSSDLSLDSIGSRLHAGIMALNYKRRAIIVGVDNRALEIAKDTHLPVVRLLQSEQAYFASQLEQAIHTSTPVQIKIPLQNIKTWKGQEFVRFY